MVSKPPERRNRNEYSLDAIHRLAAKGNVSYGSKDVQKDIDDLQYSLNDVCKCLESLSTDDYDKSINYGDHKGWLDVYLCKWTSTQKSPAETKKLYIKLKLNKDCILIVLASFHPEGTI